MLVAKLLQWNKTGVLAEISDDSSFDYVTVARRRNSMNVRKACLAAAANLRKLADDFELIANADKPFHSSTHEEIARRPQERLTNENQQ